MWPLPQVVLASAVVTERALKFLPIVVGTLLGWLLVHPPSFLSDVAAIRYVLAAALVSVLLLLFTAAQISSNLPEDVAMERLEPSAMSNALGVLRFRLLALGFVPVGPPLNVGVSPPAVMVALVHTDEPVYATAYQTGTLPAKIAFDFVSIFEGDRGGLTSNAEPAGAALPASPGSLRQVFRDAPPERVLEGHRQALAYLGGRGLEARAVSAAAFETDFRAAMRRQRRAFLSAPLRRTALTLWRVASRSTPHLGPVESQPAARREIEDILSGRTASAA